MLWHATHKHFLNTLRALPQCSACTSSTLSVHFLNALHALPQRSVCTSSMRPPFLNASTLPQHVHPSSMFCVHNGTACMHRPSPGWGSGQHSQPVCTARLPRPQQMRAHRCSPYPARVHAVTPDRSSAASPTTGARARDTSPMCSEHQQIASQ